LTCACLLLPAMAAHSQRHTVRAHAKRVHSPSRHHSSRSHTSRHQRTTSSAGITPARATEIQNALIRAGYLRRGSGVWDNDTAAAMRRYQQDHHWQTRLVPDARALIALGLGPRRDQNALYPVVARTAPPVPSGEETKPTVTDTP
jgi:hypothetical protein